MKKLLKKFLPEQAILYYHFVLAKLAALVYGAPGKKMIVIGVTGTKGKTSTINFIWSALTACGFKTGIISTANIRIGDKEQMNQFHMTMPGRFNIQKLMAQMVKEGCKYCLVETTTEGIKQSRHVGVYYDIGVFTNLTPEHLQAHGGSFEKYKAAKGEMFKALSSHEKQIDDQRIEKVIIANSDSEHAPYYLDFTADQKITFSIKDESDNQAWDISETSSGVKFRLDQSTFELGILGKFNVYNALPAIVICRLAGADDQQIARGLKELEVIPGRMEIIDEGQDYKVIVDYAHEKESMTVALEAAQNMKQPDKKVIILLGAEGGGRDKDKRPIMGQLAAEMADYVICSNVDPYEDDPTPIVEDIAVAAEKHGKVRDQDLFVIEDRRKGIEKAIALAGAGDIVLITGKGAEQSIVIDGVSSPWDDRDVVREVLQTRK